MGKFSHPKTWPSYLLVILSQFKVAFWNLWELSKVSIRYYRSFTFLKADLLLTLRYLFKSPFRLAKDVYGETPLTTLDKIASECRLLSKDIVYDLGCGRGRALFWLRCFINCEVHGFDNQPIFINHANFVKRVSAIDKMSFTSDDITKIDLSSATAIYFYGTCYSDELIETLIQQFKNLQRGTKIISVSFPLTEYVEEPRFELKKSFKARYPWGKTDIYLHVVN